MRYLLAFLAFVSLPAWAVDCHITEFRDTANVNIPAAQQEGDNTTQHIDDFTTEVDSSPFQPTTRFILLVCTAKTHYVAGASPTATAASPYLPADTMIFFGVESGHVLSVYDGTS